MCMSGNMANGRATERITCDQINKSLIIVSPPIDTVVTKTAMDRVGGKGMGWCIREYYERENQL